MSYTTQTAKRNHDVRYYIKLAGIQHRLAESKVHADDVVCIIRDSISGGSEQLDERTHVVSQGALTWRARAAPLLEIIRRRGGTETKLAASLSRTSTSVTLLATTLATETVYLDKETIILGAHAGAGVYTGCTRAAHGSTASAHGEGVTVATVPRHIYARDATLVARFASGDEKEVWWGTLSKSPESVNGTLAFEATGRLNAFLNRPLLTGFREIQALDIETIEHSVGTASDLVRIYIPDVRELAAGEGVGFVRIGDKAIVRFDADDLVDGADPYLLVRMDNVVAGDLYPQELIDDGPPTIQQVDLTVGRLGHAALQVILSDLGDEVNHGTYDILPGRVPRGGVARLRVGAGVPAALVDVDSWQQIEGGNASTIIWHDEPTRLGDWVASNILWRAGAYLHLSSTGLLAAKKLSPYTVRGAVPTMSPSDIVLTNYRSVDDETQQIGQALLESNYDPARRRFLRRTAIKFAEDFEIVGERLDAYELRTKGLWVGGQRPEGVFPQPQEDHASVESFFDRIKGRQRVAGARYNFRLKWTQHELATIGYRFRIVDARLPDHRGGMGVDKVVEIVGKNVDWKAGFLDVETSEVPRGWLLAPSGLVGSWDGPRRRITFKTSGANGTGWLFDANPGLDYAVGWSLRIYDASANPPYSVSEVETITAVTASYVEIASAPGAFTPGAEDIVVVEDSGDIGATNDVGADVEDFAFGGDATFVVGTGAYERPAPQWG